MADYAKLYKDFRSAGVEVVAISVDPPDRSAALRQDLGIQFPILSDSSRAIITQWGLLNEKEHGGIAIPATFLIDRDRVIRLRKVEEMTMRIDPRAMLEFVRANAAGTATIPRSRGIFPGIMFMRAVANGFRHGVRVKRG